MRKHICTSCQRPIDRGEAVIRSIDFVQVAWHRDCPGAPATQDHEWTGTAA
ncbi:MAG TPA: hypothetical protein VF049_04425 [Nocardioidaceae bacterium]